MTNKVVDFVSGLAGWEGRQRHVHPDFASATTWGDSCISRSTWGYLMIHARSYDMKPVKRSKLIQGRATVGVAH